MAVLRSVSADDIEGAVRALRLDGLPLCVHSSLRSFGRVDGGADAVVDGLLAAGCTLLVPTFTAHRVPAPAGRRYPRNAMDYDAPPSDEWITEPFDPASTVVSATMGAIPRAVARRPGRHRSAHPGNSFCALGPLASELTAGQEPLRPYVPFERLIGRGGAVLLVGVGLDRMTLIHLAEVRAGRELFRRWAAGPDGEPIECCSGGCSTGFGALGSFLEPAERRLQVGRSLWRAFDAADALRRATEAIRIDPEVTRCHPSCERCRDAIAGGPIVA